jgi:hypothetical protein
MHRFVATDYQVFDSQTEGASAERLRAISSGPDGAVLEDLQSVRPSHESCSSPDARLIFPKGAKWRRGNTISKRSSQSFEKSTR